MTYHDQWSVGSGRDHVRGWHVHTNVYNYVTMFWHSITTTHLARTLSGSMNLSRLLNYATIGVWVRLMHADYGTRYISIYVPFHSWVEIMTTYSFRPLVCLPSLGCRSRTLYILDLPWLSRAACATSPKRTTDLRHTRLHSSSDIVTAVIYDLIVLSYILILIRKVTRSFIHIWCSAKYISRSGLRRRAYVLLIRISYY